MAKKKEVVDTTGIKGVNPLVKLGDEIIILTGNKETAVLENLTSKVIAVENTVLKVKGMIGSNSILKSFMQDGRDGTKYVKYSRSHKADELREQVAFETKEFNKKMEGIKAEIYRLSFKDDEAFETAEFAKKVKAVK